MIERLQRAREHIEDLPEPVQEEVAELLEQFTEPYEIPTGSLAGSMPDLPDDAEETLLRWRHEVPQSLRDARAVIGAWRDLQDDDEFEALDRIRHSVPPTLPIELDDL